MRFDKFTSRVTVRGAIQGETGLHIGKGGASLDPSATDSPIIRDRRGNPFIPGSSFKGALRAHIESIVRGLNRGDSLRTCDPLIAPCISKADFEAIEDEARIAAKEDNRIHRARYDEQVTKKIADKTCHVCNLFGSSYLAAHAMIRDLFVDPDWWAGRVELRDGVGIDRDTETARHGIKYDFEVVPASTRFALEITVENADAQPLALLAVGLKEMEQGRVALGGKTTRGLGSVTLILEEIDVVGDEEARNLEGEGSIELIDYLISGNSKKLKGTAMRKYLEKKRELLFG